MKLGHVQRFVAAATTLAVFTAAPSIADAAPPKGKKDKEEAAPEPEPEPEPEVEPPVEPEPGPELIEEGETEGAVEPGEEPKPIGKKPIGKKPKTGDDEELGSNARNPQKAAELAEQGMAALSAGRRTEASSLFNQAISYDHSNSMALMGLSQVYFDTGSNQKAVLYAEKAVKAAPKNSNYRIHLGDAYFKVLRYRDALEQYEKAKDLGSSKADARISKAKEKIGG